MTRAERDARRLSREIDAALPPRWSENIIAHPHMQRCRDELAFRLWKHKALLHRVGTVGPDWELFAAEVEAFTYINKDMALDIAGREPPAKEEAAA